MLKSAGHDQDDRNIGSDGRYGGKEEVSQNKYRKG